jgi:hypothetical protein
MVDAAGCSPTLLPPRRPAAGHRNAVLMLFTTAQAKAL